MPAGVSYYVDLSKLTAQDAGYDETSRIVTINLPPLVIGDVAFEREGARTINGGLLTYSQATVDALSRLNYGSARKAIVKLAQGRTVIEAAEMQAKANIQAYFEIPLRIVGRADIEVVASFSSSG